MIYHGAHRIEHSGTVCLQQAPTPTQIELQVAGGDLQGDDDDDDECNDDSDDDIDDDECNDDSDDDSDDDDDDNDDDECNDDIDDDSDDDNDDDCDDDFADSDEYNDDGDDNDDHDTIYSSSSLTISSAMYLSRSLSSRPSIALTTSSIASTGTLSTALFKDDRSLKCRAILIAR